MKYNFDEVINRKNTFSSKHDQAKYSNPLLKGDDPIQLWVADMDFACPKPLLDDLKDRIDHGIFGYTSCRNESSYSQAIINWFSQRYDFNIQPKDIHFTANVVQALYHSVKAFTNEGDQIIIQTPSYGPFNQAIIRQNRQAIYNPLINNDGYYQIDFDDLREKAKTAKMLIFCSPHNPTGRVWKKEELEEVLKIVKENDLYLISDEIHCDIVRHNQKFISFGTICDYPKLVVCTSPSKTFNLGGVHCANTIIKDEELGKAFEEYNNLGPSPFALTAIISCYTKCDEWLKQLLPYIDNNFELTFEHFKKELPEAKMLISEGTYLAWVDLSNLPFDNLKLEEIISSNGVYVQSGRSFVADADKHLRINLATPKSLLIKGLTRLTDAIKMELR